VRLRFSRRALAQLEEIFGYIAAENERAAAKVTRRIEAVAQLIARHPTIGRPTALTGVRVFRAQPYQYLIFYRWNEAKGEIIIARIRHTARREDWRKGR
jgi:toxin ParE1/3/4